jgi:hypothetical protein
MYQAVMIYAPEQAGVEQLAAEIKAYCGQRKLKVHTRTALEARIPDLAAADLIFIGSDTQRDSGLHPDFAELKRSLAGVNLAPRVAGLFTTGNKRSLEALRGILTDSNIDLSVEFPLEAAADGGALNDWLNALLDRVKEKQRVR